jgi:hypothetical protein
MSYTFTKREFLLRLSVAASCVFPMTAALGRGTQGPPFVDDEATARARCLALFSRLDSAAAVGSAYLRVRPSEASVDRLLQELALAGLDKDVLANVDAGMLSERVRASQVRDFAAGRVVELDGWILSETEARVCALAALPA